MASYDHAQVAIAIEPRQRLLVAFRAEPEPLISPDSGLLDLSGILPGFQLDVAELFFALIAD